MSDLLRQLEELRRRCSTQDNALRDAQRSLFLAGSVLDVYSDRLASCGVDVSACDGRPLHEQLAAVLASVVERLEGESSGREVAA